MRYIHHFCPNRTASDVDDGAALPAPAALAVRVEEGPRVWPWVVAPWNTVGEANDGHI